MTARYIVFIGWPCGETQVIRNCSDTVARTIVEDALMQEAYAYYMPSQESK